ncbi:hypothetical protein GD1_220 [Paraglaciecola Antarctic GD virus 1]|nr:hypothetical protein GD1_220 [Paraglaciecola Antarctic GD virus 1]
MKLCFVCRKTLGYARKQSTGLFGSIVLCNCEECGANSGILAEQHWYKLDGKTNQEILDNRVPNSTHYKPDSGQYTDSEGNILDKKGHWVQLGQPDSVSVTRSLQDIEEIVNLRREVSGLYVALSLP